MRYLFDNLLFDTESFELKREGEDIALPARTLSLLAHLIENRHRVVGREELAEFGWPGRLIADQTLTARLSDLRKALGSARDGTPFIRTVYGQGFRFTGDVVAAGQAHAEAREEGEADGSAAPEQGQPAIAVLPFRLIGEPGDRAILADAVPDDIITQLSRLRWLAVIARGSCFQFPSYSYSAGEVGARLQVRYCLSGTMEIAGDTLRLTVELAETVGEHVVWREDFRAAIRDVHAVREDIALKIASRIDQHIPANELERAKLVAPDRLDAWQNYHLGIAGVMTSEIDRYGEARAHFRSALALDPAFARAKAGLANTHFLETLFRKPDMMESARQGMELALAAAEEDPHDSYCTLMKARMDLWYKRLEQGMEGVRRAIEISPSYSVAYSDMSRMQVISGEKDTARRSIETALRLNPIDPYNHTSYINMALIEFLDGNFAEAAEVARRGKHLKFRSIDDQMVSLLAFHFGGDPESAALEARSIARRYPDISFEEYLKPIPVMDDVLKEGTKEVFRIYGLA